MHYNKPFYVTSIGYLYVFALSPVIKVCPAPVKTTKLGLKFTYVGEKFPLLRPSRRRSRFPPSSSPRTPRPVVWSAHACQAAWEWLLVRWRGLGRAQAAERASAARVPNVRHVGHGALNRGG